MLFGIKKKQPFQKAIFCYVQQNIHELCGRFDHIRGHRITYPAFTGRGDGACSSTLSGSYWCSF